MITDSSIELMRNVFFQNKENVFLIDALSGREFTYGEIESSSLQLASLLSRKGIQQKDRVAILLANSLEFVIFYFSCMQLGAIPVPININLALKDITYIISNSNAKMVVAEQDFQEKIMEIAERESFLTFFLQTKRKIESDPFFLLQEIANYDPFRSISFQGVQDEDTIIIVYTSGTTSLPKGVEFTYQKMISNALAFIKTVQIEPSHRFYEILSLAYMAGFYNLMLVPFLAGGSTVIEKTFDFSVNLTFWKKIKKYNINALWLVPSIISSLLPFACPKEELDYCNRENIKLIFSGTAPLPESVKKSFEEKFSLSLYNTYGLSELLFVSANSPSLSSPRGVGKVLPGCQILIINAEGREVARGEWGEIAVFSPYRMRGYFGMASEKKCDESLFFATGDIGYLDADNFLYITDRKKDLIIRGGINISPAEIEEVILQSKLVREVAVIGVPDLLQGEKIVAVINPEPHFKETELFTHCRRFLSSFKVPEQCFYLSDFPRSVTGKIQKNKLKELLSQNDLNGTKINNI